MADPLSVGAGIVGIVVPALHGTRLLLDDLRSITDAPKALDALQDDLHSIEMALTSLKALKDADLEALGGNVTEQLKVTLTTCTRACELFRADLQQWTKHSDDGKLSLQDRVNFGFFRQRQTKQMSIQLQTCQININTVTGVATL